MKLKKFLNELFINVPDVKNDLMILRISMVAELDAVNLYEKLAERADDEKVRKVLLDVAHEEKVHASEFETLLKELDNSYEDAEEEGEEEVENI